MMLDLSAQALKRLGLIRYIVLKFNYSINNLVVVTIFKNIISNLQS